MASRKPCPLTGARRRTSVRAAAPQRTAPGSVRRRPAASPSNTTVPASTTSTRSMSRARSRSWVDMITCWLSPARVRRSSSRFRRSSSVDGSSRTRTVRVDGEHGGQGQELAFAAGELVDALVRQCEQAEALQRGLGAEPPLPGVPDGTPQRQLHVLAAGGHHQLGQRVRENETRRCRRTSRTARTVSCAVDRDGSVAGLTRPLSSRSSVDLPGAVGADHADPPFGQRQGHVRAAGSWARRCRRRRPGPRPCPGSDAAHARDCQPFADAGARSRSGKALCRARAIGTARMFLMMSPG